MQVSQMIEKLEARQDAQVNKREMIGWLKDVTPERDLIKVDSLRVGDTFWHKLVGGKPRPWVVLWVRKGFVGAATLTHADLECGFRCDDRFWGSDVFIGPTVSIFPVDKVSSSVYYPYTNRKHLTEVKKEIARRWK